jgi:hypothetical protein
MPLIVGSVQRRGLRMLSNFSNDAIALTKSFSTSCTSGGASVPNTRCFVSAKVSQQRTPCLRRRVVESPSDLISIEGVVGWLAVLQLGNSRKAKWSC